MADKTVRSGFNKKASEEGASVWLDTDVIWHLDAQGLQERPVCFEKGGAPTPEYCDYYLQDDQSKQHFLPKSMEEEISALIAEGKHVLKIPCSFSDPDFAENAERVALFGGQKRDRKNDTPALENGDAKPNSLRNQFGGSVIAQPSAATPVKQDTDQKPASPTTDMEHHNG